MHPELDTFVLSVAESSGVHERCVFEVWRNEKIWNPIFSRSDGGHTPSKNGGLEVLLTVTLRTHICEGLVESAPQLEGSDTDCKLQR